MSVLTVGPILCCKIILRIVRIDPQTLARAPSTSFGTELPYYAWCIQLPNMWFWCLEFHEALGQTIHVIWGQSAIDHFWDRVPVHGFHDLGFLPVIR